MPIAIPGMEVHDVLNTHAILFSKHGLVSDEELKKWTKSGFEKKEHCHRIGYQTLINELNFGALYGETLHYWILEPLMGHEGIEVVIKPGE